MAPFLTVKDNTRGLKTVVLSVSGLFFIQLNQIRNFIIVILFDLRIYFESEWNLDTGQYFYNSNLDFFPRR